MFGNRVSSNRGLFTAVLTFLLLYLAAIQYLRRRCFRDPSSYFFQPEAARVLSYSAFRKTQARKFADQQAALPSPVKWSSQEEPPRFCVAISSVSRHGFSYLKETIGSVLEGLDERERRRIYLVVFLAHSDQTAHEDYGQPWLAAMTDSLPTYRTDGNPDLMPLIQALETDARYEAHARKQKIDYSVLLDECAKVNPEYTITLEDDVVALDGWYHRTLAALNTAAAKTQAMGRDSYIYLRIFYDGRLLGWNSEEWPSYAVPIVSLAILETVVLLTLRWRLPSFRAAAPLTLMVALCAAATAACVALFFASGRYCLIPKETGVHLMQSYGCCAQGLVFPQEQVGAYLLPMYRDTTDDHAAVDTFLEDYANAEDALRFAVTPVLIQHVGGKSSHGSGDQEYGRLTGDMPFDYFFETNDPIELAEEHERWLMGMGVGEEDVGT